MRPLLIGIAGGSGSGKTTIAQRVRASLARSIEKSDPATESVVIIEHDAYYRDRDDLTYEERCQLNFDHPDSLETSLLVEHLKALREGQPVDVPLYDFKHHRRSTEKRRLGPTPAIIVEGILVFADAPLREQLDVKIYVDTDADIRAFRRIRRDIEQRGRTFDSVREQYYKTVRPMHLLFVEPSKRYADVIIPEGGENRIGVELVTALVERIRELHRLAADGRGVVSSFRRASEP
ncbi:MAG: uridine kinase [Polyangiaceae bacterium]